MTTTTATTTSRPGPAGKPRWPYQGPPQRTVLLASLAVVVGAFLPWIMTGLGNFSGMGGPGTWTVFAGVIGVGSALMRRRWAVALHATVIAAMAIAIPIWQVLHLWTRVGFEGWLPGFGMLSTLAAGLVMARAAAQLLGPMTRSRRTTPPA